MILKQRMWQSRFFLRFFSCPLKSPTCFYNSSNHESALTLPQASPWCNRFKNPNPLNYSPASEFSHLKHNHQKSRWLTLHTWLLYLFLFFWEIWNIPIVPRCLGYESPSPRIMNHIIWRVSWSCRTCCWYQHPAVPGHTNMPTSTMWETSRGERTQEHSHNLFSFYRRQLQRANPHLSSTPV